MKQVEALQEMHLDALRRHAKFNIIQKDSVVVYSNALKITLLKEMSAFTGLEKATGMPLIFHIMM